MRPACRSQGNACPEASRYVILWYWSFTGPLGPILGGTTSCIILQLDDQMHAGVLLALHGGIKKKLFWNQFAIDLFSFDSLGPAFQPRVIGP